MSPSNCPSLLIVAIIISLDCCNSETIWTDPLNDQNGVYVTWTKDPTNSANVIDPYTTDPATFCPLNNYCWQLDGSTFAYYISSTLNFNNISITYSISGDDLDGNDQCAIYYSIDSSTTNWTPIDTPITTDISETKTTYLPNTTYNNNGVGIKIASEPAITGNKADYCYFSDITLKGNSMPTSMPTTSTPTTSQPSLNPTTSMPTTSLPTTSEPTSNPTTSEPSYHPTTSQPTSIPTTSIPTSPSGSPTGTPSEISTTATLSTSTAITSESTESSISDTIGDGNGGSKSDDNENSITYGIYAGIGGIICVLVVVLMLCKNRRKSNNIQENVAKTVVEDDNNDNKDTKNVAMVETGHHEQIQSSSELVEPQHKYDRQSMNENAKRTNVLPSNFWNEDSYSDNRGQVIRDWQKKKSNVIESNVNLTTEQKTMNNNDTKSYPSSQPDAPNLQQIFGVRNAGNNEPDSDDDSIMKKQQQYEDSYNGNNADVDLNDNADNNDMDVAINSDKVNTNNSEAVHLDVINTDNVEESENIDDALGDDFYADYHEIDEEDDMKAAEYVTPQ